jgi:hypothetical protein
MSNKERSTASDEQNKIKESSQPDTSLVDDTYFSENPSTAVGEGGNSRDESEEYPRGQMRVC